MGISCKSQPKLIGRFAPTPSGPLHFGSLVAALGSYIIAKQNNGDWLLRIEDIDPPRVVIGAADNIIRTLEAFGFEWNGDIVYQSQRNSAYQAALEILQTNKLTYMCNCSRKLVQNRNNGIYDGYCRNKEPFQDTEAAVRLKFDVPLEGSFSDFHDRILGHCHFSQPNDLQDFVLRRRDGLFAYQLAVVIDDIEQGVNHVVRGADILDSTTRQNYLYHCFNLLPPTYYHLPLVTDINGNKYSKSQFSPAIKLKDASSWLVKALQHLGQNVESELASSSPSEILNWSIKHWQLDLVPKSSKRY
jgi:glutamyl-Q tRNA(Asp) synthetase